MPDEKTTAPQFDADALAAAVQPMIEGALSNFQREQEARSQEARREQNRGSYSDRQPSDPVAAAVMPYVQPALNQAALQSAAAIDAATFYASHPEAAKYKNDMEAAFNKMMAQGVPLQREELWKWYRGSNEDKFFEEKVAAKQAEEARKAADAGAGAPRPDGSNAPAALVNPFGSSPSDLDAAMKNVSF